MVLRTEYSGNYAGILDASLVVAVSMVHNFFLMIGEKHIANLAQSHGRHHDSVQLRTLFLLFTHMLWSHFCSCTIEMLIEY